MNYTVASIQFLLSKIANLESDDVSLADLQGQVVYLADSEFAAALGCADLAGAIAEYEGAREADQICAAARVFEEVSRYFWIKIR